jgi:tRNA dimethylallyltransferase
MQNILNSKVLFVVGPTAAGKTSLSIELARRYQGEILSSDSMQIYQGFTIGTAKATKEEQAEIPHHLLDMIEATGTYSVAEYQRDALELIEEIQGRGKTPIVVGGTGLYMQSLLYQLDFSQTNKNDSLRKELESKDTKVLYDQLLAQDPEAKDQIHPNNRKRVIRALEILSDQERRKTDSFRKPREEFSSILIGINFRERSSLYKRINERVDLMIKAGWIEEIQSLIDQGVPKSAQAFQAIGYPELLQVIEGEIALEEAIEVIKQKSRRYAKRQLTWFRKETNIRWFYWEDYDCDPKKLFKAIHEAYQTVIQCQTEDTEEA